MLEIATVNPSSGSDWRGGFLFVGNLLILDFLNTCPLQNGEPLELLPDFDAVLRWFRSAGVVGSRELEKLQQRWGGSARAREFTAAVGELREKMRDEILAWEQTGKLHHGIVDELNRLMTEHPMLRRLKREASGWTTELWFEASRPEDLMAPLAHSAAELFAGADRGRVRKCGHCVLHFYDTSKKGTRRWCSMQLCGNRLKVAAYAARHRTRAASTPAGGVPI
jgi:predicted RNA-binding Zn ribbon-like protein